MSAKNNWYNLSGEEIIDFYATDEANGLAHKEAEKRLKTFGANILIEKRGKSVWRLFIEQFQDFMVLVLLGATLISGFLGEYDDAITILAIVVVNAILGLVQEYRAEKSLASLKKLSAPMAKVLRNGQEAQIPASNLVPGDILLLETGDRIPADARLLETHNLEVEESLLTGESLPVRKHSNVIRYGNIPLGDCKNCVFMGTTITRGRGKAVVVATGMHTEMGRIAGMIQEVEEEQTPLQRRLEHLGKWLVFGCVCICLVVVFTGILRGESVYLMFLAGVSLAVAAIPEGLPAVVTMALAIGVQRMIKRNAIVRKLPAVETLGCATVICSDKTGTLTQNEMTVCNIYTSRRLVTVTGVGYEPKGKFFDMTKEIDPQQDKSLRLTLEIGLLCNNASLVKQSLGFGNLWRRKQLADERSHGWGINGDPTEGALIVAAAKAGLWKDLIHKNFTRVMEIPFEAERKRMTVVCQNPQHKKASYVKGASDVILEKCTHVYEEGTIKPLNQAAKDEILQANETMARNALRVLAVAYKPLNGFIDEEECERGLIFVGLLGMIDPPRPEAKKAVAMCKQAGIKTVMITGDHKGTAFAIGKELRICDDEREVITGQELDRMDDEELIERVEQITVYARVSPVHKLRIVRALKAKGHIVAMTGDGVNDAPAVKEADIGIAMGKTGTDVTKEASAMVLTNDNFSTIVAAVEEGRAIYDNIRKFIRYLLSCNVGEVLTMFLAALAGLPIPLIPIQILWVNLVTDGLPAMALGVDPADRDIMQRPPRHPRESIFSHGLHLKIVKRGTMIGLSTLGIFLLGLYINHNNLAEARTMAFTTLVMCQLFHVFDCKSEHHSIFTVGIFSNMYLIGAVACSVVMQLSVIYLPFLQSTFATVPLSLLDWLLILGVAGWTVIWEGFQYLFCSNFKKKITVVRV